MADNVKIKKVSPYPIQAKVFETETTPPHTGYILRLTTAGFLIQFNSDFFKVGENHICQFEIPVLHKLVRENVKVIKTYDRFEITENGKVKNYLVEFHFLNLKIDSKSDIVKFVSSIGQR